MRPDKAAIEALYTLAGAAGLDAHEVDGIAKPHLTGWAATTLRDARSQGELRTISSAVQAAIRAQTGGGATTRQIDYITRILDTRRRNGDGGGFMTGPTDRDGIARLSQAQASTYIDSLTEQY